MSAEEPTINFYNDGINFILSQKNIVRKWLHVCAKRENHSIGELSFIFTSDKNLKNINKQFLGHNYFTDVITFPAIEKKGMINGEIYISIERVKDNAKTYGVRMYEELHRVMIHGMLHLCGYEDETESKKANMRKIETRYLQIFP
jgi:rRNA maturation RNase YbeY